MANDDPIALMIPWYAAGTLSPEERLAVDRHLPGCASCRELLERSTSHASLYASALRDDEHVHPRLLVAYAEAPQRLDAETRTGIEARLRACEICREALAALEETSRSIERSDRAETAAPRSRTLWGLLSSTLLRPAPALAYLLLLLLATPWALERFAGARPASGQAVSVPTVVRAPSDRAFRAGEAPSASALRIPAGPGPILLLLVTDLTREDVSDPASSFAVEMSPGPGGGLVGPRSGKDFTIEDGRAVLPVLLDSSALRPFTTYVIGIRVKRPGDPMDGQMLYRARVVLGEGS